jgi:hypothetical protein
MLPWNAGYLPETSFDVEQSFEFSSWSDAQGFIAAEIGERIHGLTDDVINGAVTGSERGSLFSLVNALTLVMSCEYAHPFRVQAEGLIFFVDAGQRLI